MAPKMMGLPTTQTQFDPTSAIRGTALSSKINGNVNTSQSTNSTNPAMGSYSPTSSTPPVQGKTQSPTALTGPSTSTPPNNKNSFMQGASALTSTPSSTSASTTSPSSTATSTSATTNPVGYSQDIANQITPLQQELQMMQSNNFSGMWNSQIQTLENQIKQLQTSQSQGEQSAQAAQTQYQGDVTDFNNMIPEYRNQALGNIVARGLGASFDPNNQSLNSGALGSQVMNNFDNNVGNTLGSMEQSYNDFQGNQQLQQQARANALANFFQNQGYFQQYQQQQQPGLSDFLGIGTGILSLI